MKRTVRKGGGKGNEKDTRRDGRGAKSVVTGVRNKKSTRRDSLVIPMIKRNGVETTKREEDTTLIDNEKTNSVYFAIVYSL